MRSVLKQGSMYVHSIEEYKNGTHEAFCQVFVKSANGELFTIYKTTNNLNEFYFAITDEVSRVSKKSVVSYLEKH